MLIAGVVIFALIAAVGATCYLRKNEKEEKNQDSSSPSADLEEGTFNFSNPAHTTATRQFKNPAFNPNRGSTTEAHAVTSQPLHQSTSTTALFLPPKVYRPERRKSLDSVVNTKGSSQPVERQNGASERAVTNNPVYNSKRDQSRRRQSMDSASTTGLSASAAMYSSRINNARRNSGVNLEAKVSI